MSAEYPNRVVWAEIPVADMQRAKQFYEILLGAPLTMNEMGSHDVAMLPYPQGIGASGHLYPGLPTKNGEGIRVHIAVFDELSEAMERVNAGGGTFTSDVVSIPAGTFFYANDTEGNPLGIFKV